MGRKYLGKTMNGLFEKLTIADLQDWYADYLADGTIRLLDGDWQGSATIEGDGSGHSEQTKSTRLFEMARAVNYTRSDND